MRSRQIGSDLRGEVFCPSIFKGVLFVVAGGFHGSVSGHLAAAFHLPPNKLAVKGLCF